MNEEELRKKIGREEQMEKIDKYRILNTIAKKGQILSRSFWRMPELTR